EHLAVAFADEAALAVPGDRVGIDAPGEAGADVRADVAVVDVQQPVARVVLLVREHAPGRNHRRADGTLEGGGVCDLFGAVTARELRKRGIDVCGVAEAAGDGGPRMPVLRPLGVPGGAG